MWRLMIWISWVMHHAPLVQINDSKIKILPFCNHSQEANLYKKNYFTRKNIISLSNITLTLNPWLGGRLCLHFFIQLFFHGVWILSSQVSWLFLIYYELSENQFSFVSSHRFWVIWKFRVQSTLPHSSNIQKPPTIGATKKGSRGCPGHPQ